MLHSFLPMFYSLKLQGSLGRQGLHPRNLTNYIILLYVANCAEKQSHSPTFQWLPNSFWKLTPRTAVTSPPQATMRPSPRDWGPEFRPVYFSTHCCSNRV